MLSKYSLRQKISYETYSVQTKRMLKLIWKNTFEKEWNANVNYKKYNYNINIVNITIVRKEKKLKLPMSLTYLKEFNLAGWYKRQTGMEKYIFNLKSESFGTNIATIRAET